MGFEENRPIYGELGAPTRRSRTGLGPAIEPVCGMSKRKLENGGQRLALQNLGFGPENPENPSLET